MAEVTVNIHDILSDAEVREVVVSALRAAVAKDAERILSNMAYEVAASVLDKVVESHQDLAREELYARVGRLISDDLSPYVVFRQKDSAWSRDSVGQLLLQEVVLGSRDKLEARVSEIMSNVSEDRVLSALEGLPSLLLDRLLQGHANRKESKDV